jgi:DNA-binding MarR family transcriptional regulator
MVSARLRQGKRLNMNMKYAAATASTKVTMAQSTKASAAANAANGEDGRYLRLIRGTILDLVRRDGRDLTARQLTTLLTIYLQDEVYSVSMLAKMLNISRPGVTRILDRLVEAHLVSRAEDAADRRRVLVYRTSDGARYIEELGSVAGHVAGELAVGHLV